MKKIIVLLLSVFVLSACNHSGGSDAPVPTDGGMPDSGASTGDAGTDTGNAGETNTGGGETSHQPIAPLMYQAMLQTGMDVDWAKTASGRVAYQHSHDQGVNVPRLFRERGLRHVRIRIKDDVRDPSTELTGRTLLEEVRNIVDDSLAAGMIPVLAYQAKPFKLNPTDDAVLNDVIDWWVTVAKAFKDYPYALSYDLIIETTDEVKKHNDRLNLLYEKATAAIRAIDEKRIVIVAANKISSPYELENLIVPEPTDYMMAEWHFYAAGPSRDNPKKLWTTGTDEEKQLVLDKINTAVEWSERTGIPTWVGAWRANRYPKGEDAATEVLYDGAPGGGEYTPEQQVVFATFVSRSLQEAGIPYAVNSDTKFFNRETNQWYESMQAVLDAMLRRY